MSVVITGGSGFIGTNLVEHYLAAGAIVCNIDIVRPQNPAHDTMWKRVNILDRAALEDAIAKFSPTMIIHAAARTDLDGRTIDDYSANTQGVRNIIGAASAVPSLQRIVFLSTMLVCKLGYMPTHDTDYCPNTMYGQSKVAGERLVRAISPNDLPWVIVRPTSIWGPWFATPYRGFFEAVRAGWFVLPRGYQTDRSYGYIDNLVAQLTTILSSRPEKVVGKTFYLADYEPFGVRKWANLISAAWNRPPVRSVPLVLLKAAARLGDVLKMIGVGSPPLTSYRLNNLLTPAVFDMSATKEICPTLPATAQEGVRRTIAWLRDR